VGDPVELLHDSVLPYPDASFDLVVVGRHVRARTRRCALGVGNCAGLGPRRKARRERATPRAGVSVAARCDCAWVSPTKKHGHVRPGYDRDSLRALLQNQFQDFSFTTTVGPFSEIGDIVLSLALEKASGGSGADQLKARS
jgi:hypothetical protein